MVFVAGGGALAAVAPPYQHWLCTCWIMLNIIRKRKISQVEESSST